MTRSGLRRRLARVENDAARIAPQVPLVGPAPAADDAAVLAGEIAAAFGELLDGYREHFKLAAPEAAAKAEQLGPDSTERAMGCLPDQVTWIDLNVLEESDPALALRRWEEVKQEARAELRSGHRAARALEGCGGYSCWPRVQFLALRSELAEAWRPRDAQELLLIDQMAQFQTMMERWQLTLTAYTTLNGATHRQARAGRPLEPPRVSDAEALELASAMVERMQRLYLRAMKALQDRRRGGPPVVVRRAGQVNVGAQQVNVCGGR
jgi:hypothetical protein